jgi:hypothetical protein
VSARANVTVRMLALSPEGAGICGGRCCCRPEAPRGRQAAEETAHERRRRKGQQVLPADSGGFREIQKGGNVEGEEDGEGLGEGEKDSGGDREGEGEGEGGRGIEREWDFGWSK